VAAIEAAEALQHCEDEAARPVLERIAAEEARHAELAWRFVAWALQRAHGTPAASPLRESVRAAFAAERDALAATSHTGGARIGARDRELARHGVLSLPVRHALRARVLREVVAPSAAALLEERASGPAVRPRMASAAAA
jgi:hypothetical protein